MHARILAVGSALLLATSAMAGARWHTTYATGHKLAQEGGRPMIVVFGRPGEASLKNAQKMFDDAKVARMTRYFVCIHLELSVQNKSFSHPKFATYKPGPGGHKMPIIFFADAKEKTLEKTEGAPDSASLARTMATALKAHGPVADPKKLSKASSCLKLAESLREKGNLSRAAPLYQEVIRLASKAPIADTARGKLKEIESAATRDLETARLDITDKAYPEAVAKLKTLCKTFPTLKAGKEARTELAKLAKVPEAKAALEGRAAASSARKVDTSDYAFTDEELAALDVMGQRGDEVQTGDSGASDKAERLLRMARNWQANKQPSQARKYLRQIIAQYPTTDQAETAKRLLRDLK